MYREGNQGERDSGAGWWICERGIRVWHAGRVQGRREKEPDREEGEGRWGCQREWGCTGSSGSQRDRDSGGDAGDTAEADGRRVRTADHDAGHEHGAVHAVYGCNLWEDDWAGEASGGGAYPCQTGAGGDR